jgi:hypothetical protein
MVWKTGLTVTILLAAPVAGTAAPPPLDIRAPTPLASPPSDFGHTIITPRGPIVTTGRAGSFTTTTLPRRAGQGLLFPNGNGTSTLIGPRGSVTTVPTPR